ncbi:Kar1p KNAG_0F01200 [Huiozyma naganishii CBS 8797]|uniref:Uncharacterized protein n=1 Tax=Huiozyma naganishii (strain ATCC MYA-139 / BCRC 22969 / CBS 8797 / KCTC 17520 / NBRC 10181 / NCYC 3082 / Yp74L-3) TaxID=1071383 RepID=J7RMJ6_HUIN7|nr:hypothetical protein KNAG_0F01200 [Kazachstania naganishii CBS 8797]CCK70788.1 hypothetical protein KNAG_0F01200 [Kazachstania naganishii CBS 8797]
MPVHSNQSTTRIGPRGGQHMDRTLTQAQAIREQKRRLKTNSNITDSAEDTEWDGESTGNPSVVSNNSTSIMNPNEALVTGSDETIKSEIGFRHLSNEGVLDRGAYADLKEDPDDEYFPSMISRNDLIFSSGRKHGGGSASRWDARPLYPKKRVTSHEGKGLTALRKSLGEPIPLHYMSQDNTDIPQPRISNLDPIRQAGTSKNVDHDILPDNEIEKKRKEMTAKWRTLLTKDKLSVEKKLKELELWHDSGKKIPQPKQPKQPERVPSVISSFGSPLPNISRTPPVPKADETEDFLLKLRDNVDSNSQKLDQIIALLSAKQPKTPSPEPSHGASILRNGIPTENMFWTLCIIVLFVGNVMVYHYL